MQWIVTDNIYQETWCQLLEYSNIDLTIEEIIKRHGAPKNKSQKEYYEKQARQARACVLQAKEYFDAANTSSLHTGPNHAYYGSIALSSLSMLILGDGNFSLDQLRKDSKNTHHGLNFTIGCNEKSAKEGIKLLEESRVEVLEKGHFSNWYNLLPPTGKNYAETEKRFKGNQRLSYSAIGLYKVPSIQNLKKKKTLIELIKYLPDLHQDLKRYEIHVDCSRTSLQVMLDQEKNITKYEWRIHGCRNSIELNSLLAKFQTNSKFESNFSYFDEIYTHLSGYVIFKTKPFDEFLHFSWPTSRDTMNHQTISYADMDDTHEIVDLYLISYQFSMLSRYYPDIWVNCLESQCKAAKLIERANAVIIKKLPILILSVLRNEDITISTHRAPWQT